ncbi:putative disease resistance protein RGA4 [Trifolium pratense]|uniref:putative disease resistance protein RGA4 n=1 Tax=Trifolium pratense TaxID=57577 RepID=UPI001E691EAB|nr:putative disease resistance protein RGA4 [Trifolium pratense]
MAHGYLDCSLEGKCMEDLGNQFVNIFLMKSFFQEAKLNEDGDIIGFKMHDLIHDLAKQVAETVNYFNIQTLACLEAICNFEDVRLCVSFEKLKHLRFLDLLKSCMLESLHKSIGNLICLQTIKVRLDEKVVLSTKVVSKLINLRHLDIRTWTFVDKTPVGNFSGWLSPLTHIIEITLTYCQGLQYLPPLECLPFLKSLELCDLDDLEYIYCEELILHEPFFASLKRLEIRDCVKLVGWKRKGDDFNNINTSHHLLLPQFPCLSFLKISECPMLTHMPTCPNIKKLSLQVQWTSKINIAASQYSISCTPLSLQINQPIMDVKNVPRYWWQNLTSLENLEFVYFSSQHFQATEIWFKDDINYLPSLQKITFHYCDDLKALPDWICNISSLQHIKIDYCNKLTLLPERMSRLTNLHTLEIFGDSLLVEEFQKKTSATWSKIAHIPNIIIRD